MARVTTALAGAALAVAAWTGTAGAQDQNPKHRARDQDDFPRRVKETKKSAPPFLGRHCGRDSNWFWGGHPRPGKRDFFLPPPGL